MICKKCGHEDLTGAAFCPKCGKKLEEAATYATPVSAADPMPKKNTAKIIIIAAVIVALLAGAGVVTYFGFFADDPWFVEGKAADGGEEKKEEKDHSEEAKAAVEEIMDGVVDYDKEIIEETLDIEWVDVDAMLDEELEPMGDERAAYDPAFDLLYGSYFDSYEYKIGEIKEKDGKYTVAVEFKCITIKDIDDASKKGADNFAEKFQDMIDSGEVTNKEEGMSAVAKGLKECMYEALEGVEKEVFDLEFVVVEKDGEWVVDVDESDYKELKDEIESIDG